LGAAQDAWCVGADRVAAQIEQGLLTFSLDDVVERTLRVREVAGHRHRMVAADNDVAKARGPPPRFFRLMVFAVMG